MDTTIELGSENYVLRGGRGGQETLLNTDIGRERQREADRTGYKSAGG